MSDSDVAARVRDGSSQRRNMDEDETRIIREPGASGSVSSLENDDVDDRDRDCSTTADERQRDG